MARDGSGIYSAPAGTTATAGTTIESAKYNAFVNDLVSDANTARPIVAGGTGATTAGAALTNLGGQPLDAGLTSIAGLTTAADRMIYTTAADTYAVATLTAAGRAILDDANAAAQLTTLGIGGDIPALEALASTGIAVRTAADTWATRAVTSTGGTVTITNPGGVAGDINLEVASGGVVAGVTTSGAATYDLTVPSTANEITIQFSSVSLSGADNLLVQLGDSGGIETSGYVSTGNTSDSTAGFLIAIGLAARAVTGLLTLSRVGTSEQWISSHSVALIGERSSGGGSKTLSAAITTIRIAATGANTFDGGVVSIRYR